MNLPIAKKIGALAGALLMCSGMAYGQQTVSPQGGAGLYVGDAVCVGLNVNFVGAQNFQPCFDATNNGQWFTVMNAQVKASTNKSLFVSPALETGIYTNTQVKGGSGSQTATAVGSVAVRVLLDCSNCAAVGKVQAVDAKAPQAGQPDPNGVGIVYDARIQQLTATLGNVITLDCLVNGGCTPEQIDLIISTTSAHAFNFILTEVGAGAHTITVQARLDAGNVCYGTSGIGTGPGLGGAGGTGCTAVTNSALASSASAALFGLGSVTIIPVQLAPGFNF